MRICRYFVVLIFALASFWPDPRFGSVLANDRLNIVTTTLPGALPFDGALLKQLEQKRSRLDSDYSPRTRHKHPDGWAMYTNRLFLETSPYLIQHAHNPVNWYPWGEAAFAAARRLNRPVLLSVGYATCHWCHVMEEESFEDPGIAAYLNANFIAIKVDREERPDIDAIYMQAVQAMTGRGGWPLNVWLTTEGQPFYGGTYVPARDGDRGIRIGFLSLLQRIKTVYDEKPDKIKEMGRRLTTFLDESMKPAKVGALPDAGMLHQAAEQLKSRYDPQNGGILGAPKFPSSLPIRLLLRYHRRSGDDAYLKMATHTLKQMAAGGIYDHVGGGFHRYATDSRWRVPHFEKMLYDNAQLAVVYLEAFQATGDPEFRAMVMDILTYIAREMTDNRGGFFSATDADSLTPNGHREEGFYFTWTPQELEQHLGARLAQSFTRHYGVTAKGNFEGRNILHRPDAAAVLSVEELDTARKILYRERQKRPAPLKDDKIITAWNGMMISAFARSGAVLRQPSYVDIAERAADFILAEMTRDNRLYRSYRAGEAKQKGFLEDYALFISALLDLYEATQSPRWLSRALDLDLVLSKLFEDDHEGGFFRTGKDQEALLAREKPYSDGALPSGNAIALLNLMRLGELTFDDRFRQRAEKGFKAFTPIMQQSPGAVSHMLLAVDFYLDQPKEIVIVTRKGEKAHAAPFLAALDKMFLPNRTLTVAEEGDELKAHARLIPVARGKIALQGKASAYVCIKGVCDLPTILPEQFDKQIRIVYPIDNKPGKGNSS